MRTETSSAPLVGRERELDLLLERWELAREGAGQAVTISADAGIGKTRLVQTLIAQTGAAPRTMVDCVCLPYHRYTPFSPLVDFLRRERGGPADALASGLGTVLTPPHYRRITPLNLSPEGQAKKTLEAVVGLFLRAAQQRPLLLVIEDVDRADPSTLELLTLLIHRRPAVPMLVVATGLPGAEPRWGRRPHLLRIELEPLTPHESRAVLDELVGDAGAGEDLRRQAVERAAGVPLVLEELALALRAPEPPAPLPSFERCLARRLEPRGELARLAAALGEWFADPWLRALSSLADRDLDRGLAFLETAGALVRGRPGEHRWRHALLRAAIHDGIAGAERAALHRRIFLTLRERFPETLAEEPELLIHHGLEAGMLAEAADLWCHLAGSAVRHAAYPEAIGSAEKGLTLVAELPERPERRRQEVTLRIALGAAVGTARGYAVPEAQEAYDRALELIDGLPASDASFIALQELASYYLSRGQVRTARGVAEQALAMLDGATPSVNLSAAQRTLGFIQLMAGELEPAKTNLERSLAPYAVHRSQLPATPPAIGIPLAETLSHLSMVEWFRGHPTRALRHSTDALTLARRFNDPFTRVFAIFRASSLHVLRQEPVITRELAHELVEMSNRQGFLFFIAAGMFLEGQALAAQGRAAEGIQMMSGGLDGVWASGIEIGRPRNLAMLAAACGRSELVEQGLSLVREARAVMEIEGESHFEAEIRRIQGELLASAGAASEEIEEEYRQALVVARRQGARALELRAATSLARFWQGDGRAREARELLASVYGTFDEGFDTADLQSAEALLESLR